MLRRLAAGEVYVLSIFELNVVKGMTARTLPQVSIVIYSSCGPFDTVGWYDHPNVTAILNAGGLGQETGNAITDVLFGRVNPSAKLPYTLAAKVRRSSGFCSHD
jgi:hypothetical protein